MTRKLLGRRLALLGGTASFGDCLAALRSLLDPIHMIEGPQIRKYEEAFARRIGTRFAISFSSARVGLFCLLRTLGIGNGDDVLLQVPTHIVVANAIRFAGARPVFVDCDLDDYNMDAHDARRKLTPATRAIVVQHTFGIPANLGDWIAFAARHGLELVEDCVHALGARYDDKLVGCFGRAAMFSTEETKTISTTMGGMITTDDADIAARLRQFQSACAAPSRSLVARYLLKFMAYYFLTEPHIHRLSRGVYERMGKRNPLPSPTTREEREGVWPPKYEQRLSNAQAALGIRQLAKLDRNLAHRARIAELYRSALVARGVRVPQPAGKAAPAYVRFPIWLSNRNAGLEATASSVVLGTWFTSVLEEAVSPSCGGYQGGSCPNAESAALHLANLPTHERVSINDVDAFVAALEPVLRASVERACNSLRNE